ncbi:hypothetical protein MHK_007468 [Candidatus Magnetomorum sp. HK-1]|nr:hypothetical protein MHK_007468 [Candidatus Magnetomorum sp. HK-1]
MSKIHIVNTSKDGLDSFLKIANNYEVSFPELKNANKDRGNPPFEKRSPGYVIYNGDEILIPRNFMQNNQLGTCVLGCSQVDKKKESTMPENKDIIGIEDYFLSSIPYLQSPYFFKKGILLIFGNEIPANEIEKMRHDMINGVFEKPKYEFDSLGEGKYGYYYNGIITLDKFLVIKAQDNFKYRWALLLVMLEEYGHHIDYILRNKYTSIGGDAKGDEGQIFAGDYIHYNDLLESNLHYATVKLVKKNDAGTRQEHIIEYDILEDNPPKSMRREFIEYSNNRFQDKATIRLKDGTEQEVEFFAIRGLGAMHEEITEKAAQDSGITYDKALEFGCEWPDLPCESQHTVNICYNALIEMKSIKHSKAYKSHYGIYSYWHAMSPGSHMTNQQVKYKMLIQAERWYTDGLKNKGEKPVKYRDGATDFKDRGLFFIGKLLHMIQDSYTQSHAFRDRDGELIKNGIGFKIKLFQGYINQDPKKHELADNGGDPFHCTILSVPGATDALKASTEILKYYKSNTDFKPDVYSYLDEKILVLDSKNANEKSGASHSSYAKEEGNWSISFNFF